MSRSARRDFVTIVGVAFVLAGILWLYAAMNAKAAAFTWSGLPNAACVVEHWTVRLYGSEHIYDPCPGPEVVNNPLRCTWSRDDSWALRGSGDIPKGTAISGQVCDMADGTTITGRNVDAGVLAKNDSLLVTLATNDGRAWAAVPVRQGNLWYYDVCTRNNPPGPYAPVEGSNGGEGNPITYTLTVAAPERTVRDVRALIDVGHGIWSVGSCAA